MITELLELEDEGFSDLLEIPTGTICAATDVGNTKKARVTTRFGTVR